MFIIEQNSKKGKPKLGLISIETELKELNEYELNSKFQALSLVDNGVNLSIKDISIYPYFI